MQTHLNIIFWLDLARKCFLARLTAEIYSPAPTLLRQISSHTLFFQNQFGWYVLNLFRQIKPALLTEDFCHLNFANCLQLDKSQCGFIFQFEPFYFDFVKPMRPNPAKSAVNFPPVRIDSETLCYFKSELLFENCCKYSEWITSVWYKFESQYEETWTSSGRSSHDTCAIKFWNITQLHADVYIRICIHAYMIYHILDVKIEI